jgi:DNA-binding NtrC family response regulator
VEGERARAELGDFRALESRNLEMQRLLRYGARVARTPYAVLIEGETGTGKELFARGLHAASEVEGPFVPVNCSAIPAQMFEAELFGARRGAYTGLTSDRPGLFRVADHGTLFLDEIADLPADTQGKLLRVLESGMVRPLGTAEPFPVKVRVITASHKSLARMVEDKSFRSDLFFRLTTVCVRLPPLRDRPEDLPDLVRRQIDHACSLQGIEPPCQIARAALRALARYPWPGNIRELQNVIGAAVLASDGATIELNDLPDSVGCYTPASGLGGQVVADRPFFDRLAEFEEAYMRDLLARTEGNLSQAARIAGLSRTSVRKKARAYGLIEGGPAGKTARKRVRKPALE